MDKIPVFYDDRMIARSGSFAPSAAKPRLVVDDWKRRELKVRETAVLPASIEDFDRVHSPEFVKGIMELEVFNGFNNTSASVRDSLRWTTGSMITAAWNALLHDGVACSPTSGFHHAGYDYSSSFCTFNGLMATAMHLLGDGIVHRVGIVDYDYHWGDGTHDIIERLGVGDDVSHVSICEHNNASEFLDSITDDLNALIGTNVGIILFQAGADPHIDDPLGGFLTTEDLRERDRLVFEWCRNNGVPVVWNLAGGYQRDREGGFSELLRIHRNTMEECVKVFLRVPA